MPAKTVTSTEFQQKAGQYIEDAGKAPVIITKHNRPSRVLVDFDFYQRIAALDTRKAAYTHEISKQEAALYANPDAVEDTPELDHLIKS